MYSGAKSALPGFRVNFNLSGYLLAAKKIPLTLKAAADLWRSSDTGWAFLGRNGGSAIFLIDFFYKYLTITNANSRVRGERLLSAHFHFWRVNRLIL